MAAIIPFLKEAVFGPEDIHVMSAAMVEVCRTLQVEYDARAQQVIAARIIELVRRGERDAARLRDHLLAEATGTR